jgi:hypothetical protein
MDEEDESAPATIRVVTKRPNEDAKVETIDNVYTTFHDFCEGIIDMTNHPKDDNVSIVCNDEGLINGMEANIVMPEREGVLAGPIIMCGYDPENGNSISLTEKQEKMCLAYCKRNQLFHMSLQGAYRYAKVIGPLQEADDEAGIGMEA